MTPTPINAPECLAKTTDIYYLYANEEYEFIHTTQPIKKYLSNIKNRNKNNLKLKLLINADNFNYLFIEKCDPIGVVNRIGTLVFEKIKKQKLEQDLIIGLGAEHIVLKKINAYFENDIIIQCKYKYSIYDFFGLKSEIVFELKTNADKYGDYPNAIIGINKVIPYLKQIFLFNFKNETNNGYDLYYFINKYLTEHCI